MKIIGVEGLTNDQVRAEIQQGAKFVVYSYCISAIVITFRRSSDIHYIRPGENAVMKGMQYTLLSLFLGWWGFPWGVIYTPIALFKNLSGGKDVTAQLMQALAQPVAAPANPARFVGEFDIPQNPW